MLNASIQDNRTTRPQGATRGGPPREARHNGPIASAKFGKISQESPNSVRT